MVVPQGWPGGVGVKGSTEAQSAVCTAEMHSPALHRGALLQQVLVEQRVVWTLMTSVSETETDFIEWGFLLSVFKEHMSS